MTINQEELIKKLEKEGFKDIRVCPIEAGFDSGEHMHNEYTVHIILNGELKIKDKNCVKTFFPGDRVEFPAGTTHSTKGSKKGNMIVGVKRT